MKKLFNNLRISTHLKGNSREKISTFFLLTRLGAKSKYSKKRNELVSERFLGNKLFGYDYATINLLFKEVFLSNEYFFQSSTQQPLIIDCGANIGMSITYFKGFYPESRIIAFEANPHAFKLLEKNIETNKFKNVELHNIALYDKETEISFFIGDNIGTLLGSVNKDRGGNNEMKVKTVKLSDYLKDLPMVDLIKMDVEGAEINIVNDLFESGFINKAKEYIVEYHHNINEDKSALSSFLQKFEINGFNYNIKADFDAVDTFQDLLIHFYKKS